MIREARRLYAEHCGRFAAYDLPSWEGLTPRLRRYWRDLAWTGGTI